MHMETFTRYFYCSSFILSSFFLCSCEKQKSIQSNTELFNYQENRKVWTDLELNPNQRVGQQITLIGAVNSHDTQNRSLVICLINDAGFCDSSQKFALINIKAIWTPEFLVKLTPSMATTLAYAKVTGAFQIEKDGFGNSVFSLTTTELPEIKQASIK